jgi:hypothetical protein
VILVITRIGIPAEHELFMLQAYIVPVPQNGRIIMCNIELCIPSEKANYCVWFAYCNVLAANSIYNNDCIIRLC